MLRFGDFLGNRLEVTNLRRSIILGRVNHACIFSGPSGLGKKRLASTFAKALQCPVRDPRSGESCGGCSSCIRLESGNHPDVIFIKPEKTKSIGVDDIRERIINEIKTPPFESPYKIFIINNADAMTTAAQSAFLKTMEEPGGYGIFILLAENPALFMPTVLSRCGVFSLKPPLIKETAGFLKEKGASGTSAETCAAYAQGNIGRALSLLEDTRFIEMREYAFRLAEDLISSKDTLKPFFYAKELEIYKDRINEFLDILFLWHRDLLIIQEGASQRLLTQKDQTERLYDIAPRRGNKRLLLILDGIIRAREQLRLRGNYQIVMENLLLLMNRGDI